MRKTIAVIQARTGSSRLPNKVLKPIAGRSLLDWVVRRVQRGKRIDQTIVATSIAENDNQIEDYCRSNDIDCFRGSESDVLGRFIGSTREYGGDLVIRINADNPLVDPESLDQLMDTFEQDPCDYLSYCFPDGRPVMLSAIGFFAELITAPALRRAAVKIQDPKLREHVTLGIYLNPESFLVRFMPVPPICLDDRLRMTVDTQEDLNMMTRLMELLGPHAVEASIEHIIETIHQHEDLITQMETANKANPKTPWPPENIYDR